VGPDGNRQVEENDPRLQIQWFWSFFQIQEARSRFREEDIPVTEDMPEDCEPDLVIHFILAWKPMDYSALGY